MYPKSTLRDFCAAYLNSMNPVHAASACGLHDGFALLNHKHVRSHLDLMRDADPGPLREDVIRKLAQLAFASPTGPVRLALAPRDIDPQSLDLSALSELKVTEKGVEIKLIDRVRALDSLFHLLASSGSNDADDLYHALEDAASHLEGHDYVP